MASFFKELREDIDSIFARDPAARTFFEILTTYPGVHAIIFHRLTHKLYQHNLKWLARIPSPRPRWVEIPAENPPMVEVKEGVDPGVVEIGLSRAQVVKALDRH